MPLLWSSDKLISHEFPNPAYLLDPVVPQGGTVLFYGKPGVGKTQLILTLSQAINSGTDFLNRWPARQGPVVVIQADMTGQIQQDRVARVIQDVNLSETYWVVEEDGSAPYINIMTMAFKHPELVESIRKINPVAIIYDTVRKVHTLPENASESPVAVYNAARQIHPPATSCFIGHTRKESTDPDANQHADEAFMGNQQWKGSADATASLVSIDDNAIPRRLFLTFHKARTAPDIERRPVMLELDMGTILLMPVT